MKHRFLSRVAIALAVAAVAVPLAHATNSYDGYKSSYPQLHQLTSNTAAGDDGLKSSYPQLHQLTSNATAGADGLKSSYPQLHQLTSNTAAGDDGLKSSYPQLHQLTSNATAGADGYKSSYPQLHVVLAHKVRAPLVPTASRGFDWRDAAIGAGTGAGAIFLLAGGALFFSRRHTRLAT